MDKTVYVFLATSIDSKAFKLWKIKCHAYGFVCINLIEDIATSEQKADGYDLADYNIEYSHLSNDTHNISAGSPVITSVPSISPEIKQKYIDIILHQLNTIGIAHCHTIHLELGIDNELAYQTVIEICHNEQFELFFPEIPNQIAIHSNQVA